MAMKRMSFSEKKIIKILHEVEIGYQVKEVFQEFDISDATYLLKIPTK